MTDIKILTESDLRGLVPLDLEAIACIEDAFAALATKDVVMPPILRLDIKEANGEVDVKTAYVPGLPSFAIKVSPGFFDNPRIGLPSVNGLMMLLSAKTGLVEAMMLDNGYLTDVRTAAAGAVAARHLAREDARSAGIIGAGVQARLQLEALCLVRPIERAAVWARSPRKAEALAGEMSAKLGIAISVANSPEDAVAASEIIVTTTPSTDPIVMADWLSAGQHLTAMGSDAEHKNEIEPALVNRADLYVADSVKQTERLGELHHAIEAGLASAGAARAELGTIIAGRTVGRSSPDQITFADLTGTGVQDTAIATLARQRAEAKGAGKNFTA